VFEGQTVSKSFDADVELEFQKSQLLWNLGREFNFRYPEPLRFDPKAGRIQFERINNSRSIRLDYIRFMTAPDGEEDVRLVFERAGRILGIIHRELCLSNKHQWKPSEKFTAAAVKAGCSDFDAMVGTLPHAFLHGDYGLENIELVGSPDGFQLVVFDASPNYFVTFHANSFGPVYVDIGSFLSVLYGLISLKYYPLFKWNRVATLQSAFLDGYSQTSGIDCNLEIATIFSYASASSYLQKKYKRSFMHDIAMWLLFNRLKGLKLQ
jgi:hypothetical protein